MALVAGGLALPERGLIVAGGFGLAGSSGPTPTFVDMYLSVEGEGSVLIALSALLAGAVGYIGSVPVQAIYLGADPAELG